MAAPALASLPRVVAAFARATHLAPTVAVTAFVALLAAAAQAPPGRTALAAAAVLAGQASVGWANDWIDAPADRAGGRRDKPTVAGTVSAAALRRAALAALVAALALTVPLGPTALAAHGGALGAAWAYDAGLKRTLASPLPYAVAFALLPVFVAAVAGGAAPPWTWVAAGLLGAGAHFTNTVGDLEVDAATGVSALPHRLGAGGSLAAAGGLLAAGVVAVGAGLALGGRGVPWLPLLLVTAIIILALAAGARGRGRAAFRLTLAAAGGLVLVLLTSAAEVLGPAPGAAAARVLASTTTG